VQASDDNQRYDRHIRTVLVGVFIMALAFFLDFARDFLLPVFLAFFIALTFRPAIRSLARRHIPEWLAASGFMAVVVFAGFSLIYFMVQPVEQFIRDAPAYAQAFSEKAHQFKGSMDSILKLAERLQQAAAPQTQPSAQEVVIREAPPYAYVGLVTGYSLGVIATAIFTMVTAAFLMASGDLFYAKLVRVLPTMKDKKTALRIVYDVEHDVSSYLLIITAINAGLGVAVAVSFYILGMPTPYVWGALAFGLNFIPYVGAVTGMALSAFMAIIAFDSLTFALLVPLSYAFWNGIENQFISPFFLGRRLQLNSVAILLALAFWTWLWGIAGTVVAVPILVTIKVFCDHLEGMSGIGEFLSEKYPEDGNGGGEERSADVPAGVLSAAPKQN
jgi:predicted PurR-regulated permease PerM